MSYVVSNTLLSPGITQQINLVYANTVQALKVSNISPYNIQYDGFGTVGQDWIPAGTEYMLYAKVQSSGYINLTAYNTSNISPANPGAVLITVYVSGETLPEGNWPVSIPFQTVNTSSATVGQLVNTGNPPTTNIISVKPSDALNPTWTADNSGNLLVEGDISGVLTLLIQLISSAVAGADSVIIGDALRNVHIPGTLSVDNTITLPNSVALKMKNALGTSEAVFVVDGSNDTNIFTAANGAKIQFIDNTGTVLGYINDVSGLVMNNLGVSIGSGKYLTFEDGSHLFGFHNFSGTGNGSFSTTVPSNIKGIAFDPCTVSGSSQTIGGTIALTSVVTTGAGLAWNGTAYNY